MNYLLLPLLFIILPFFIFKNHLVYAKAEFLPKTEKKLSPKQKIKGLKMMNNDSLINLKVEKYSLDNGMTVLLHQDQRVPQIYHQLLIKVGSRHEEKGKTGLAHLFEHMMFRGTKKYTGEEYENILESMGANNNAFTSRDYTAYEVTLPNHQLETILQMEAERLKSLKLTQYNLDKEREVVKEERRLRTDNDPNEFFEPLMSLVFPTHSYGRPIIGSMEDLENTTVEDCKDFYEAYYSPNNTILVLVGNFDTAKTKKWIKKYYGALQPSSIKPMIKYNEEPQKEVRLTRLQRGITAPTLVFAYRVSKSGDDSSFALDTLNRILVDGESSRLHREMVYKHKLALSVGGFYYGLKEEGVFIIFVKMAQGKDPNQVKDLLAKEMAKVLSDSVTDRELLKSTRAIMNDYISAMKSFSGKANALSLNEAYFGDYRELFKDLERYKRVTLQDIKEQANVFLTPEKISIVELLPSDGK